MAGRIRVLQLLVSTAVGGGPRQVLQLTRALPRDSAGFDLVHSHGKGAGLYGRYAAWRLGVPAIHTFHGIHYDEYPAPVARLYLVLERVLARATRVVINVSHSQEREGLALRLFAPAQSRVIVNGLDGAAVGALAAGRGFAKAQLGLAPTTPVIGTVARFDPVKAIGHLADALALLRERIPAAHLVLAGGGGEEKDVRRHVARARLIDAVTFLGTTKDVVRVLPALDVFVYTSRKEGLPLAVLEATACGLPRTRTWWSTA